MERVEVVIAEDASGSRRHRELAAFARYCVARIERELGEFGHWCVRVGPSLGGFTTSVAVGDGSFDTEVVATGADGALSIWDAMCRIEQDLRDARARRR